MKALWCRQRGHLLAARCNYAAGPPYKTSLWCERCDYQFTLLQEGDRFPDEAGYDPIRPSRVWWTHGEDVWNFEYQVLGPLPRFLYLLRCTLMGHAGFWRREIMTCTWHHECRDCRTVFGEVLSDSGLRRQYPDMPIGEIHDRMNMGAPLG